HQVLGLTRSKPLPAGATVHRGSLEDLDSLKRGADAADAVIHTAFNHDFTKWAENCEADRRVIEALGSVGKLLVVTSGTALTKPGQISTEAAGPAFSLKELPRVASEEAASAVKGAYLVRLPPTVHGEGDHGFVPMLIAMAREKGVSGYVGEGKNRWPAVHRLD